MKRAAASLLLASVGLLLATASLSALGQTLLDFSATEQQLIASHGPWPAKPQPDLSNRVEGRRAARDFGHQLFASPALSATGLLSCATCHQPARAFQDGQPAALSAKGAHSGIRNTPTLLDSVSHRWWGWDGAHDSLWAASLAPLLNTREMGHTVASLAAAVRGNAVLRSGYRQAFRRAPPQDDETLVVDLAKALAAYQATLISPRTPFDQFRDALLRGDRRAAARYPLAAQRGLRLFVGVGRCNLCHAGPSFTNGEFADIGVPFFVPGGVDPGRHGGLQQLLASRMNRLGRYNDAGSADPRVVATQHVIMEPRHFGEFKVPGLRMLTRTAPYMHNGSLARLQDVVRHYSELNEDRLHADGERILRRLNLTQQQQADLVAFLRSLSQ